MTRRLALLLAVLVLSVLHLLPVSGQRSLLGGKRSLLGEKRSLLEKTSFDLSSTSTEIPETILRVNEQGQYSIQAESSTGTRIDLVDRMAGVMSSDGQP